MTNFYYCVVKKSLLNGLEIAIEDFRSPFEPLVQLLSTAPGLQHNGAEKERDMWKGDDSTLERLPRYKKKIEQ